MTGSAGGVHEGDCLRAWPFFRGGGDWFAALLSVSLRLVTQFVFLPETANQGFLGHIETPTDVDRSFLRNL